MAVLAVPINHAFEVKTEKISKFLEEIPNRHSKEITENRLKTLNQGKATRNDDSIKKWVIT